VAALFKNTKLSAEYNVMLIMLDIQFITMRGE